jgi:hypothetical protein
MKKLSKSNLLINIFLDKKPSDKDSQRRAAVQLIDAGCVKEKKEDRFGETKSGWWQDTVFLGVNPVEALQALRG